VCSQKYSFEDPASRCNWPTTRCIGCGSVECVSSNYWENLCYHMLYITSQPLWCGEFGILFRKNALVEYGFRVAHSDGTSIEPASRDKSEETSANLVNVLHAIVGETVHLKPNQMKWAKAIVDSQGREVKGTWLMSPNEKQLAKEQCDTAEALQVPLNNWGSYPIIVKKGNSYWYNGTSCRGGKR